MAIVWLQSKDVRHALVLNQTPVETLCRLTVRDLILADLGRHIATGAVLPACRVCLRTAPRSLAAAGDLAHLVRELR